MAWLELRQRHTGDTVATHTRRKSTHGAVSEYKSKILSPAPGSKCEEKKEAEGDREIEGALSD